MKKQINTFLMPLMLITLALSSLSAQSKDSRLIEFELKDQFDREYSHLSWAGEILVVIGSDRGGSKFNENWGRSIYLELAKSSTMEQIAFAGVADLRGVPFFLKGFVKGKFPKAEERWVLMDWDGEFAKAYQFEKDHSNILIFNQDKKLVYQTAAREVSEEKLQEIVTEVRELLTNGTTLAREIDSTQSK